MTFTGKVHIIKSLGTSVIMYACDMIRVNEKYVNQLNELLYNFLWDGRKQIRREICVLPRYLGGIGMIDLNMMIKVKRIKWIVRILRTKENEKWNVLPLKYIRCLDNKFDVEYFMLKSDDCREI